MILRIDRLQTEMPLPSTMSTFMNYTFQSFNFRAPQADYVRASTARRSSSLVIDDRPRTPSWRASA